MDVTALSINFNTPEHLERLLSSFRKFYPNVPFLVIDGSYEDKYNRIKHFPEKYNIELVHFDYNIHHGPGLTEGIKRIKTKQILMIDSDIIVLRGEWLENMVYLLQPHQYGIGDVQREQRNKVWMAYLHPALALINREVALQYSMPMKGGAPMLEAMNDLHVQGKQNLLVNADWLTADFHNYTDKFIKHNDNHNGMGTVDNTGGYHLDTIGVVIATYQRPDGKTPMYLERCLTSIDRQIFRDYKVFVIGDAYANENELREIVQRHPQVVYENLKVSPERERYGHGNMEIWCAGGVTAANRGIDMALAEGLQYLCHQAHDDYWAPDHLETIFQIIRQHHPIFCCTLSTYGSGKILPAVERSGQIIPIYPLDGGMVAASTCVKYSDTKLRVVDRLFTEGIRSPSDAYLWECLRKELQAKGQTGFCAAKVTCHHDEEGYAIRGH